MNPDQVKIPLEKTVTIKGSTIEISIAEKKMPEKEKKAYKKFMAKCMSESSEKNPKDAELSCAVSFERMKAKLMIEIEEEDEEEEEEGEEGEEESEDEKEDGEEEDDKKEMEEEKSEASIKNHAESVKEPGNLRFDLIQDANNPAKFMFYEAYENEEAVAAHKETAHYQTWRDTVADWMAQPREGVKHNVIAPKDREMW